MSRYCEINSLRELIEENRKLWKGLKSAIWRNPELAFDEKFAAATQVKLFKGKGFQVTESYCGLETAYRAEIGTGEPAFAFFAEYDALPGIGHGCGHNLICTAALAAASATAELLRKNQTDGRVVVLGTPAEESGGGKVKMLKRNCLDDVDATMMVNDTGRSPVEGRAPVRPGSSARFSPKPARTALRLGTGLGAKESRACDYSTVARERNPPSRQRRGNMVGGTANGMEIARR